MARARHLQPGDGSERNIHALLKPHPYAWAFFAGQTALGTAKQADETTIRSGQSRVNRGHANHANRPSTFARCKWAYTVCRYLAFDYAAPEMLWPREKTLIIIQPWLIYFHPFKLLRSRATYMAWLVRNHHAAVDGGHLSAFGVTHYHAHQEGSGLHIKSGFDADAGAVDALQSYVS